MNINEIIIRDSTLTNGTAGLIISLMTCSEAAVHANQNRVHFVVYTRAPAAA